MKKKILLIIGIVVVIILAACFFIEAKYIKAIEKDGKEYIVKEGDSIICKYGAEIKIVDIQSEKVIAEFDSEDSTHIYDKEYGFHDEVYGEDYAMAMRSAYITFEKNIF